MRRHYIPDDDPILMDRTINHFPQMPALKWKNKHQNEGHGSTKDEKHIFNRILVRQPNKLASIKFQKGFFDAYTTCQKNPERSRKKAALAAEVSHSPIKLYVTDLPDQIFALKTSRTVTPKLLLPSKQQPLHEESNFDVKIHKRYELGQLTLENSYPTIVQASTSYNGFKFSPRQDSDNVDDDSADDYLINIPNPNNLP